MDAAGRGPLQVARGDAVHQLAQTGGLSGPPERGVAALGDGAALELEQFQAAGHGPRDQADP